MEGAPQAWVSTWTAGIREVGYSQDFEMWAVSYKMSLVFLYIENIPHPVMIYNKCVTKFSIHKVRDIIMHLVTYVS